MSSVQTHTNKTGKAPKKQNQDDGVAERLSEVFDNVKTQPTTTHVAGQRTTPQTQTTPLVTGSRSYQPKEV